MLDDCALSLPNVIEFLSTKYVHVVGAWVSFVDLHLLIILVINDFDLSQSHVTFHVHARNHRGLLICVEIWRCLNLLQSFEVQALEPYWFDLGLLLFPDELVERGPSLIDLDPAVVLKVTEDLILSVQTVSLVTEADAR